MNEEQKMTNASSPEPIDQADSERSGWSLMGSTNLEGKLGMLVVWYFDGDLNGVAEDRQIVRRLIRAIQRYCSGKSRQISRGDLYYLHDAIASYPKYDPEIDRARTHIHELWQELDAQSHAGRDLQLLLESSQLGHISVDVLVEAAGRINQELERRAGE